MSPAPQALTGPCDSCGYLTTVHVLDLWYQDEPRTLCAVCHGSGLHEVTQTLPKSHHSLVTALGVLVNVLVDGHGIAYREQVESILTGVEPEGGSYESF